MAKYDLGSFKIGTGIWEGELMYYTPGHGWELANDSQSRWYNKNAKVQKPKSVPKTSTEPKVMSRRMQNIKYTTGRYKKFFSAGTKFTSTQGHLDSWAKPMSLRGGKDPNGNFQRVHYNNSRGNLSRTRPNDKWGARVGGGSKSSATVLKGIQGWIRQIEISIYALQTQAENFRIMAGRRALKVFQNSFKYQKFYSNQSQGWPSLAPFTLKKRASRGTGSRILKEYGDLYDSIKFDQSVSAGRSRIYTDIVPANAAHHKKHSICYAGYHNEGKGTYGKGWNGRAPKHYIQRQFMGHSTYLDPLFDPFMRKMMKLYLFDSVFLAKQT